MIYLIILFWILGVVGNIVMYFLLKALIVRVSVHSDQAIKNFIGEQLATALNILLEENNKLQNLHSNAIINAILNPVAFKDPDIKNNEIIENKPKEEKDVPTNEN